MTEAGLPRDASTLVPHTGTARLIRTVDSLSTSRIEATGMVPGGHPLATGPLAPALLAIELGAQAAAAMEALARLAAGDVSGPRRGSLVRVREARFARASLPVDTPLHVIATLEGSMAPLAIYRIAAALDGVTVVDAVISTHAGTDGGEA